MTQEPAGGETESATPEGAADSATPSDWHEPEDADHDVQPVDG